MSPREEQSAKLTEQTPGLLSTAESDGDNSSRMLSISPDDSDRSSTPGEGKPPSPPKRGSRFSIATRNR